MFIEFRFVPSNFTVVPSFGPIALFCIHSKKMKSYQNLNRMNYRKNYRITNERILEIKLWNEFLRISF